MNNAMKGIMEKWRANPENPKAESARIPNKEKIGQLFRLYFSFENAVFEFLFWHLGREMINDVELGK